MGQPKQLLPYQGQTLLSYVTKCAIASSCSSVIVILGANAKQIEPEIARLPVQIVKNLEWNEGVSSSIRCGIEYIKEQFLNIDGVVFLSCDQPFISPEVIEKLINTYNLTDKLMVASSYKETLGIPTLFDRSLFSELMELKGDRGAKKIINKYSNLVHIIDFPQGEIDLDTFKDYQQLISRDSSVTN